MPDFNELETLRNYYLIINLEYHLNRLGKELNNKKELSDWEKNYGKILSTRDFSDTMI